MCITGCLRTAERVANNQPENICMHTWQGTWKWKLSSDMWFMKEPTKIYKSAQEEKIWFKTFSETKEYDTSLRPCQLGWIVLLPLPLPLSLACTQNLTGQKLSLEKWGRRRRSTGWGRGRSYLSFLPQLQASHYNRPELGAGRRHNSELWDRRFLLSK